MHRSTLVLGFTCFVDSVRGWLPSQSTAVYPSAAARPPGEPALSHARSLTTRLHLPDRKRRRNPLDIRSPGLPAYLSKTAVPGRGDRPSGRPCLFVIDRRPYHGHTAGTSLCQVDRYQPASQARHEHLPPRHGPQLPGGPNAVPRDARPERARSKKPTPGSSFPAEHRGLQLKRTLFHRGAIVAVDARRRYYLTLFKPGELGPDAFYHGRIVDPDNTLLLIWASHIIAVRMAMQRGTSSGARRPGRIPLLMWLQGERASPHQGQVKLSSTTRSDPTTSSISGRGRLANPEPPNGIRLFCRRNFPANPPPTHSPSCAAGLTGALAADRA